MKKIGVIGISPGNGHPYSWSAICNGYDKKMMAKCPFPGIPAYLAKQSFPKDQIKGVKVTHVWCDKKSDAVKIAKAALIPNVTTSLKELCEAVDLVLLARDDGENHLKFAKEIIKYGKPVFIDKPLAFTLKEAKKIIALEEYEGQVFTCSSLRYADELLLERKELKQVERIVAKVPKSWNKYAIHVIEPVMAQFDGIHFKNKHTTIDGDFHSVEFYSKTHNVHLTVMSFGDLKSPIEISYYGKDFYRRTELFDSFSCFKKSIESFLRQASKRERIIPIRETLNIIGMIEKGCKP